MSEFDEFIVQGEAKQRGNADALLTAIGLQDMDGLNVSPYLLDTARLHIEGDITFEYVMIFSVKKNELRNRDMLVASSLPKSTALSETENNPKSNICTLDCTLEETAVIRCFETNPRMTQKEMASTIRKSERTVKTITSALVEKGIIIQRNGCWKF